ncbi:MAG: hypothetical protein H5T64_11700 [Chloroflexi bacterium]|nr:hypothetical protein [Chloroflexota bacterium]
MNPEARGKTALAAFIVVLAVMAALSAAPAYAGQSWEQSPDCDERIAVWRRLPLVNTRHRMEFGGYTRDAGTTGRSPLLEIAFPGAAGSEIPTHAGRRWMNPPAGLVKSRWDWATMGRQTHSQASPPTQIAPTGYISYTIRPEDIVSQEKILANPYYREKINSTYWLPPFRDNERQKVMDECIFRATVFGIMAKNNPEIAAITDPYQQALKILEVAAVDPNLASMMPHFRGATGMSVEEASQWRQRVVNWLKENQTKNPASFRGWVNWLLEGAKVRPGVVIQVPTPTPQRPPATPELLAPKVDWLKPVREGDKIVYRAETGNPYGLEAGAYAGETITYNSQKEIGVVLVAEVVKALMEKANTPGSIARGEYKVPLPLDPRGEKTLQIEEFVWFCKYYQQTWKLLVIKGISSNAVFVSPLPGKVMVIAAGSPWFGPAIVLELPQERMWGQEGQLNVIYPKGSQARAHGEMVQMGNPIVWGIEGKLTKPDAPPGSQAIISLPKPAAEFAGFDTPNHILKIDEDAVVFLVRSGS